TPPSTPFAPPTPPPPAPPPSPTRRPPDLAAEALAPPAAFAGERSQGAGSHRPGPLSEPAKHSRRDEVEMAVHDAQHGLAPRVCRSEEHTSELQSRGHLVCRLLLEKKKNDE